MVPLSARLCASRRRERVLEILPMQSLSKKLADTLR